MTTDTPVTHGLLTSASLGVIGCQPWARQARHERTHTVAQLLDPRMVDRCHEPVELPAVLVDDVMKGA